MRDVRRPFVLAALAGGGLALSLLAGASTTYAAFSDDDSVSVTAGADIWADEIPDECAPVLNKDKTNVIWGTMGDDVLRGGNQRQVIMGLGGDDVIYGGNQGDCLVGGDGDDRLFGDNSKDVILGGNGDDYLDGGNAKDWLD